jgi:hypothetical protein
VVKPPLPVREGGQFHLSCSVTGAVDPKFIWYKDNKFFINHTLARSNRFMKPDVQVLDSATVGILFVQEAGERDNGRFYCRVRITAEAYGITEPNFMFQQVEDRGLSRLPRRVDKMVDNLAEAATKTPFRSIVTASLDVFVATRPRIEVFPRSLTVLRNQVSTSNLFTV